MTEKAKKSKVLVKVQILQSVAGKFRLSYSIGDKVKLPKHQADELIEAGYAVKIR